MRVESGKCPKCGGILLRGNCSDCEQYFGPSKKTYEKSNANCIIIGSCDICGQRGKKIDNQFFCLSCRMRPVWEGKAQLIPKRKFSCHEEEMYYKAKYIYRDNPIYLGELTDDVLVTIAYDRWKSVGLRVPINPELWNTLPEEIR